MCVCVCNYLVYVCICYSLWLICARVCVCVCVITWYMCPGAIGFGQGILSGPDPILGELGERFSEET